MYMAGWHGPEALRMLDSGAGHPQAAPASASRGSDIGGSSSAGWHSEGDRDGWVSLRREDDLTRFLEATEGLPVLGLPVPPRHHCPFCAETFENRHALSEHLASIHRGERPVLIIGGREPDQTSTIRQPLQAAQIAVENCSAARVRLNSALQPEMPPKAVPKLLSEQTDAVIDLVLINRFDEVAAPVQQPYRLILRIPDKASLDAADRAFIEHLATGMPQMAQVAAFLRDPLCQGAVSDYAEALGSYVRGLLVKTKRPILASRCPQPKRTIYTVLR